MHVDNVNAFSGVLQARLDFLRTSEVKIKAHVSFFGWNGLCRTYQFSEVIECRFLEDFGNNWCGIRVGV